MKCVSFNINGIRARLHQLEALVEKHQPDVIGLQETKVVDDQFPLDAVRALGYEVAIHGQKAHYGVALMTRQAPALIQKGFPTDEPKAQRRFIHAALDLADGSRLHVLNGYFPQGESREHPEKFPAKAKFYADLLAYLQNQFQPQDKLVLMGDMNVAPLDIDIGIGADNAKRWLRGGKCSFLPEEREWLDRLLAWGLEDTFRRHHPEDGDGLSWFDYRSKGFDREPRRGLRIDLILASSGLREACTGAGIDHALRGMEKPSDHCPIWAEFML